MCEYVHAFARRQVLVVFEGTLHKWMGEASARDSRPSPPRRIGGAQCWTVKACHEMFSSYMASTRLAVSHPTIAIYWWLSMCHAHASSTNFHADKQPPLPFWLKDPGHPVRAFAAVALLGRVAAPAARQGGRRSAIQVYARSPSSSPRQRLRVLPPSPTLPRPLKEPPGEARPFRLRRGSADNRTAPPLPS